MPEKQSNCLVITGLTRNPHRTGTLFMGLRRGGRNDDGTVNSNAIGDISEGYPGDCLF